MDHTRKRKGRACDQCRKSKSRCEDGQDAGPGGADRPCRNCVALDIECTYNEPVRKRGPPKGYMSALEQRLSNAEGLLGAIICSNDPRAMSLVSDLSTDSLANHIISRVREGEFGLSGRAARESAPANLLSAEDTSEPRRLSAVSPVNEGTDDRPLVSRLDDVFTQPSIEWQDCLNLRLALGSRVRSSRELSTTRGRESSPSDAEPPSMYRREDTKTRYFELQKSKSPPPLDDDLESMDTDDQNRVLGDEPQKKRSE